MDKIKSLFAGDALAAHLGMELLELSPGRSVTRMTVGDEHLNLFGMAHGGIIFTLADFAFEAACNSHGTVAVALNVNISFLAAAGKGTLTATAEEVNCAGRIGTYDIRVTDENGSLVAHFHGMAYRKRDPLPGLEEQ
ncbi:MAG: hydroxyphenylacetyl-CoA thioesterase PaaI [Phycisphaerae bacterium]